MIVPPDVQLKTPYSIRIRRKMQKEIPKRIPMYVRSIKVIEERRSDVPLKPHRRKFPSFGSGKMAGSDVSESSVVIRPSVIFLFHPFSLPFNDICASKTGKRVRIPDFPTKKCRECPRSAKKDTEKRKESPPYTSCGLDWFTSHDYGNLEYYL